MYIFGWGSIRPVVIVLIKHIVYDASGVSVALGLATISHKVPTIAYSDSTITNGSFKPIVLSTFFFISVV